MAKEFNITICGSPRVGKSTLVNALCGREVARVSNSLTSHTNKVEKYLLKRNNNSNSIEYSITIYDTPGIESWTKENVQSYFTNLMKESKPVCMIYCASPGSFARLDHLQWVVDTCGSEKRNQVLKDFDSLLTNYHQMTRNENNIQFYGDVALSTSVNSILYDDQDFGIRKDVEGINELIYGILISLKDDRIAAWCYTVAENQSFWLTMQQKVIEFYELAQPIVSKFVDEHGKEIAASLISLLLAALKKKL